MTQRDYSYRKVWFRDRLQELAGAMAIDVLDYAILDNHFHTIFRNRPDIVESWSDEEAVRRWLRVCPLNRNRDGSIPDPLPCEIRLLLPQVEELRLRISDISWMMRLACQPIARRANKEDKVDGRFFARRFDAEPLETTADVLNCSIYVDLNWIYAGMAEAPETSVYTSAFERIQQRWLEIHAEMHGERRMGRQHEFASWLSPVFLDERSEAYVGPASKLGAGEASLTESSERLGHCVSEEPVACELSGLSNEGEGLGETSARIVNPVVLTCEFCNPIGAARISNKGFLPLTLDQYLQLLDAVGRRVRADKRGAIPEELPPILERIGIDARGWLDGFVRKFGMAANPPPLSGTI
ncbi:MAG: hypothetical protein KDA61_07495 [Planctomycetales bacterium]|nr:hypothetical protein [Planctomycetales bacterium]